MKICLKKYAKQARVGSMTFTLSNRLPVFINGPCEISCELKVEHCRSYYIMSLNVQGLLSVNCQRCLNDFQYHYENKSDMAVCQTEDEAERLMQSYECIVSSLFEIDLVDIITDELHLYCPEKHSNIADCSDIVTNFG